MSFQFEIPPDSGDKVRRLVELAEAHVASGDRVAAVNLARAAVSLDYQCFAAHRLIAEISLTGENFRTLIRRIHEHFRPRTYIEIGIAVGATVALVGPYTQAIGVDPEPQVEGALPPNVRIVSQASDDFFASHDLEKEFGGVPLELAFIDGMHLFEYALRDFINLERNAAPATTILLHDCYPLDERTSARQRLTTFWTGDVWKLVVCLKQHRPELRIHTLASPPTGLAVIRGLQPKSAVLHEQFDALCREFIPMPYAVLEPDKRGALNLVPGDWETARRLLE